MSHVRSQIRAAVKAELDAAMAGYSVFSSRRYKINEDELPLVDMRFVTEQSEFGTLSDVQERMPSLAIRVAISASESDIDDDLDDAAVLVEHAIAEAGKLGGLLIDIGLTQTDFTDASDGDKPLAQVILRYDMHYRASATDVETAGD